MARPYQLRLMPGGSTNRYAVLCQEWSHLADDAQAALATARASPFQRATFVVNLAVVGLGLLWAILTRRRLRSTGLMPGRARG